MSIELAALVGTLRMHCPPEWDDDTLTEAARNFIDQPDDEHMLAHDLWTMGAQIKHKGKCWVENDSAYVNICEPCKAGITAVAAATLADLNTLGTQADEPRDGGS